MRVFLAGGSGAIGRPLIRALVAAGHEVTALTRDASKQASLASLGADVVVADALERAELLRAMESARPEAIVNQLTDLPQALMPGKLRRAYRANDRIRREGTANLLEAARVSGASRFLQQSSAFWYAPSNEDRGGPPGRRMREEDPLFVSCPGVLGRAIRTMSEVEGAVRAAPVDAVIVRYGIFYGPGTWYAPDGSITAAIRKRRYPIIGEGTGFTSFVHVDDAAAATVAALDADGGIYNVCDDEPIRGRDWIPRLAELLDAKPPRRIPEGLARLITGNGVVTWLRSSPGADNAKAKRELGWSPRYPTWEQGFREAL